MEFGAVSAVGVWFYSLDTERYLYLMRSDVKHNDTWALPGGKVEYNETLLEAIVRECCEELGSMPKYVGLYPIEQFTSADTAFCYHTFFCCVAKEFQPTLNPEHKGYAWIDSRTLPKPMHPGLWTTVNFDVVQQKITTIRQQIHTSQ